jgi:hypothetical protein
MAITHVETTDTASQILQASWKVAQPAEAVKKTEDKSLSVVGLWAERREKGADTSRIDWELYQLVPTREKAVRSLLLFANNQDMLSFFQWWMTMDATYNTAMSRVETINKLAGKEVARLQLNPESQGLDAYITIDKDFMSQYQVTDSSGLVKKLQE